jgi:hypothetical protein
MRHYDSFALLSASGYPIDGLAFASWAAKWWILDTGDGLLIFFISDGFFFGV